MPEELEREGNGWKDREIFEEIGEEDLSLIWPAFRLNGKPAGKGSRVAKINARIETFCSQRRGLLIREKSELS